MVYLIMNIRVTINMKGDIRMTKQEILNRLERIADSMDMDFLNRQEIEGIVKDIRDLTWKINIGTSAENFEEE